MSENMNSQAEPYVFLFDADTEAFGGDYGTPCGQMLFGTILSLQQPVCARIFPETWR